MNLSEQIICLFVYCRHVLLVYLLGIILSKVIHELKKRIIKHTYREEYVLYKHMYSADVRQ